MKKSKTKPIAHLCSTEEFSKERLFSIMDRIDAFAERLGFKIGKKAKWIGRTVFFAVIVAVIGTVCFAIAFIPRLFTEKKK